MAIENLKTIFTSYKELANEIIRITDLYSVSMVSEADLEHAVVIWKDAANHFLLNQDGKTLAPTLVRYIGKRRAAIVTTLLNR